MPSVRCRCGIEIDFDEEDQGLSEYCPSCGRAVTLSIPEDSGAAEAVPPASTESRASVRVFNSRDVQSSSVVGTVTCRCGQSESYSLDDIGERVFCSSCGAGIYCGEHVGMERRVVTTKVAETTQRDPDASLLFSTWWLLTLALATATVVGASWFAWQTVVPEQVTYTRSLPPTIGDDDDISDFDPAAVTPDHVRDLSLEDDPFRAISVAISWKKAFAADSSEDPRIAVVDEVIVGIQQSRKADMLRMIGELGGSDDPAEALKTLLDWERIVQVVAVGEDEVLVAMQKMEPVLYEQANMITPAEIQTLLAGDRDTHESLVQAEIWKAELVDMGTPGNDPRFGLLEGVIEELLQRLVHPSVNDEIITKFRTQLDKLSDALGNRDLIAAKASINECIAQLEANADSLKLVSRRYYRLKAIYDRQQYQMHGKEQILSFLGKAEEIAGAGDSKRLTDALEAIAEVKFLAMRTPMTQEFADELTTRVKKLMRISSQNPAPPVRLMSVRRGAAEAKTMGSDRPTRMFLVRLLLELSPGLPSEEVADALKGTEKWAQQLREKPQLGNLNPTTSKGRAIRLRCLYEQALDRYGAGDAELLEKVCRESNRFSAGREDVHHSKTVELLLRTIEANIGDDNATIPSADVTSKLVAARRSLESATYLETHAKWKALNGAIEDRGDQVAMVRIKEAKEFAAAGDFRSALELAASVASLGSPATDAMVELHQARWSAEVRRRADRLTAEREWSKLQLSSRTPGREIDTWLLLSEFSQRYPKKRTDEIAEMRNKLKSVVDRQSSSLVSACDTAIAKRRWREATNLLKQVTAIAGNSSKDQGLLELKSRLDSEYRKLSAQWQLMRREKLLANDDSIEKVVYVALQLIDLNPESFEAITLLEKAKERGGRRAAQLVAGARHLRNNRPDIWRKKLERAMKVDPLGEAGATARRMLESSSESEIR